MSKKNKYAFWNGDGAQTISEFRSRTRQNYINKFYNVWMSKFKWSGLDEEMAAQEENYIMRKFWSDGKICARPIKNTDLLVFAPWSVQEWNYYDLPETIIMENVRGVSTNVIPVEPQVVNRDVVIGYCQPNHKPILSIVSYYVDRMVQVDMVINTNLNLQKMPWLIGVDEADKDKMNDVINKILNDEIVVFADLQSLGRIQSLATNTPYVLDKLSEYKRELEQELMTFLGIDNNGSTSLEQTHIVSDAVNANNDVINDYGQSIEGEINKFLDGINRVFGRKISIECISKPVCAICENKTEEKEVKEDGGQDNEN